MRRKVVVVAVAVGVGFLAGWVLRRPGGFDILLSSKGFASSVAVR